MNLFERFYMLVELMRGELLLPWDELGLTEDQYEPLHLLLKSARFPAHILLHGLPEQLFAVRLHLLALFFHEAPDYLFIFNQLSAILNRIPTAHPLQPLTNSN